VLRKLANWLSDPVTQDVIALLGAVLVIDSLGQLHRRIADLEREHAGLLADRLTVSRETAAADA
jgi:hypothetical protein